MRHRQSRAHAVITQRDRWLAWPDSARPAMGIQGPAMPELRRNAAGRTTLMDSQIDLILLRRGIPIATAEFDRASEHPDITDVADKLEEWLSDVWTLVKDAWGLDFGKALADIEKLYTA